VNRFHGLISKKSKYKQIIFWRNLTWDL